MLGGICSQKEDGVISLPSKLRGGEKENEKNGKTQPAQGAGKPIEEEREGEGLRGAIVR